MWQLKLINSIPIELGNLVVYYFDHHRWRYGMVDKLYPTEKNMGVPYILDTSMYHGDTHADS